MATRDATLQALRLKYNAALAAHQGCRRALAEASMAGASPSQALIDSEAEAHRALEAARNQLFAAMSAAITGEPAVSMAAAEAPESLQGTHGRPESNS